MKLSDLKTSPEAWLVAAVWLMASVALVCFVNAFGIDFPFGDDFSHLPYLTHDKPVTLHWLWERHNEHRFPLAKLVWIATSALSHGNYRVPMFLDAVVLCLAAAVLTIALIKHRGYALYSDAAISFVLLNLSQTENLTWGHQVPFVVGTALPLVCTAIAIMAPRAIHALGFAAITCWGWGPNCAMFLGAASALFAFRAIARREETIRYRVWCATWSAILFALFASYMLTQVTPGHQVRTPALMAGYLLRLAGDALTASGAAWPVPSIIVAAICILTAIAFIMTVNKQASDSILALGAFALMMCVIITWGRCTLGVDQAFSSRYATLIAPLFCACYALVAHEKVTTKFFNFATTFILLAAVASYAYSAGLGVENQRARAPSFRTAVLAALTMDPESVALAYGTTLQPEVNGLADHLRELRRAKLSAFANPQKSAKKLKRGGAMPTSSPVLGLTPYPSSVVTFAFELDATLGSPGALVHAPGAMTFDLGPGIYDVHGLYGFRPGAYSEGNTDGAEFSVWLEGGGRRQVWARLLRPVEITDDRGPQTLSLTLTLEKPTQVTFETSPGPNNNSDYDWTVWADLQLVAAEPQPTLP